MPSSGYLTIGWTVHFEVTPNEIVPNFSNALPCVYEFGTNSEISCLVPVTMLKNLCMSVCSYPMILTYATLFWILPSADAAPPSIQKDYDELPNVKEWDGIPYHNFTNTWFMSLTSALAGIVQDGYTLLACAKGEDDPNGTKGTTDAEKATSKREASATQCTLTCMYL